MAAFVSVLPACHRGTTRGQRAVVSAVREVENPSRRSVLQWTVLGIVSLPAGSVLAKPSGPDPAVVGVCECIRVMKPVYSYIEEGEWDKARTNINYCTRNLALRKKMKAASNLMEDPLEGIGIMADLDNVFTQLDASVYTPIFIPSESGISPEQRKYQGQAFLFYAEAMDQLAEFLSLIPKDQVEAAKVKAQSSKFEIRVP